MVTHSSTSRPVQCLCMAERTGCPVFTDLWSYVQAQLVFQAMKPKNHFALASAEQSVWFECPGFRGLQVKR